MTATQDGRPLSIDTEPVDQARVRLIVSGELDIATSPYLREDLERELDAGRAVELDLSGLSFMDSTGISVVIQAMDQFAAQGRVFELSPELSDQVRRLLSMVGLLSRLPFREPTEAP